MQINVQCMGVDNLWSPTLLYNKLYLMNSRRWNYNCVFYYYYVIMEKMYKINKSNIFRMGNLPALLPNATPPVSRFFGEMSKKRERYAVVNLENNFSISAKFLDVYCNCKQQLPRISGKMGFTIEDQALIY
jgi:hypothetical protein